MLTGLRDHECDDPTDGNDSGPYSPTFDGMLLPVNRLFGEYLEEDGSRGDKRVENTDNDLHSKYRQSE